MEPTDLSLAFPGWREHQEEAIWTIVNSPKKVVLLEAPTGAGKSLIALAAAKLLGAKKSAIVCSTTQLQEQYLQSEKTLRTVKGRSHFTCPVNKKPADQAPCVAVSHKACGVYQRGACAYFNQVEEGLTAPVTVHNYAYWLLAANKIRRFSGLDLLVLDEAHTAEDHLRQVIAVEVGAGLAGSLGLPRPPDDGDYLDWRSWATECRYALAEEAGVTYNWDAWSKLPPRQKERALRVRSTFEKVKILEDLDEDWLIDEMPGRYGPATTFRPVWVAAWGEDYIFRHAEKVVCMSATILDADLFAQGLGLQPEDVDFYRLPSTFPKERRPIYYSPVARVGSKATEEDHERIVRTVDRILARYPGEKGIIHTGNYRLAQLLLARTQHGDRLISHQTKDRGEVIARFKYSVEPLVLVSPSITTGLDLPQDECRFAIIVKLPFPNKGDRQVERRMKVGPDGLPNPKGQSWYLWTTAASLVQSTGRGMRSADDRCDIWLLDAHYSWFRRAVSHMLPGWFTEAVIERPDTASLVEQIRGEEVGAGSQGLTRIMMGDR